MTKPINLAIMGASGAVGSELLNILAQRQFPVGELTLLASTRSAGKTVQWQNKTLVVEELGPESFNNCQLVLASAGGSISKQYAPIAVSCGAIVVDNTSFFRMHGNVPLVVPEINASVIGQHQGIIANPNCGTIIMAVPLWPLHQHFGIRRVVLTTYQAASGAGARAMEELVEETRALIDQVPYQRSVIPHQYAFNLFPHNSPMTENGYCEEEVKIMQETKKIFDKPDLDISATCVRVPTLRAHCESINVEFETGTTVQDIYAILDNTHGVKIFEDRALNRWPMPIDAAEKDDILVGRIRQDHSRANTFELWVSGDQIRKGAALNAVQIAEWLLENSMID